MQILLTSHQMFPLVSALVVMVSDVVHSDEFCEAFRSNDNRISYLYRRPFRDSVNNIHNIIIDGKYWSLNFSYGSGPLKFDDHTQSKSAPVFSNQFFGAVCLHTNRVKDVDQCVTLLFNKNNISWPLKIVKEWDDFTTEIELSEFARHLSKPVNVKQLDFALDGFEPHFVTNCPDVGTSEPLIEFITTINIPPNKTIMSTRRVSITFDSLGQFVATNADDYQGHNRVEGWNQFFSRGKQVMDIFANTGKNRGYVVIMKDQQKIFWCFRSVGEQQV